MQQSWKSNQQYPDPEEPKEPDWWFWFVLAIVIVIASVYYGLYWIIDKNL